MLIEAGTVNSRNHIPARLLSDKQVLSGLQEIREIYENDFDIRFTLIGGLQLSFNSSELNTKELNSRFNSQSSAIERAVFLGIHYFKQENGAFLKFSDNSLYSKSKVIEEITLILSKVFVLSEPYGSTTKSFIDYRKTEIDKLESTLLLLSEKTLDMQQKYFEEVDKRKIKSENEIIELRNKLQEEYKEKTKIIEEKESEYAKRLSEFDDRDSKHVRRELRNSFKQLISQRSRDFKVSENTNSLRSPVKLTYIALIIISLCTFVATLVINGFDGRDVSLFMQIKQGISGLAFVTFSIMFLKWNHMWFKEHADEEFYLKKMDLDIDRASWLVEMMLEWDKENDGELPDILVKRLSTGLFERVVTGTEDSGMNAAEVLASALFGEAASATIAVPGGSKVELNRKGIKRLEKTETD